MSMSISRCRNCSIVVEGSGGDDILFFKKTGMEQSVGVVSNKEQVVWFPTGPPSGTGQLEPGIQPVVGLIWSRQRIRRRRILLLSLEYPASQPADVPRCRATTAYRGLVSGGNDRPAHEPDKPINPHESRHRQAKSREELRLLLLAKELYAWRWADCAYSNPHNPQFVDRQLETCKMERSASLDV